MIIKPSNFFEICDFCFIFAAKRGKLWKQISTLSDTVKIQLINRISASLLHKDKKTETKAIRRFSNLKGALKNDLNKTDRELLDEYLSEKYGL